MAETKLPADSRAEFGKGAARRLRRAEKIPAVIYGHGAAPVHISLPGHDTQLALRAANALLAITIDGGKEQLALPKQVQRDPVTGRIEHLDLVIVKKGEKVSVEVPLQFVNEDKVDGVVVIDAQSLSVAVEATHIPTHFEVDLLGLEVGSKLEARDVKLPEGAVLSGDPEMLILTVSATRSAAQQAAELAPEGGAAPEAAEAAPAPEAEAAAE